MSLIRERLKKIKRLNIASSIHNRKLLNHIHIKYFHMGEKRAQSTKGIKEDKVLKR